MIKFGPSGLCQEFSLSGLKTTTQAASWLKNYGLDCFEYSFGRGILLKKDTANEIKNSFEKEDIEISVHAPYFINLATVEEQNAKKNHEYIFGSLQRLKDLGGKRCVFHPGSPLKLPRLQAVSIMMNRFEHILEEKSKLGFDDMILCPETMGKKAQLGNLQEIIGLCRLGDKNVIPCIDFGHLNSRDGGRFFCKDDYKKVIDELMEGVGEEKTKNMHIHFAKIEFSNGGELRHLTFEDAFFGPPFEPLLEVICDYKLSPYIVCESAGVQTKDAKTMKDYFNNI